MPKSAVSRGCGLCNLAASIGGGETGDRQSEGGTA